MVRSGTFHFFITPHELRTRLDVLRQQQQLHLIAERFSASTPIEIISPDQPFTVDPLPERINLSSVRPSIQDLSPSSVAGRAFEEGWSYVTHWGIKNGNLYQTDLGFKSPREEARHLFQSVKKELKAELIPGVIIRGSLGGPGHLLKSKYYSLGAKESHEHGIVWRQYGVPNSWFFPA